MWGQHPAFGWPFIDENTKLHIKGAPKIVMSQGINPSSPIEPGTTGTWPFMRGKDGSQVDMSKAYLTTHIGSVVEVEDRGGGIYAVTTVEGNMSNTVKRYTYLYDSNKSNHQITTDTRKHLQENMSMLPESEHTDPLCQYELHTDHWSVFGFGATW